MEQKYSFSLRLAIFLLVLFMAVASLALIINEGVRGFKEDIKFAQHSNAKLAESMASEFKILVNSARELGETLSLLPSVQNHNAEVIEPLLASFIAHNPVYANIVLLDRAGDAWASGIPLQGRRFSMADRKYFVEAMASGSFASGEYTMGKTSGKPVLAFGYPVKDADGKMIGCIAIGFDLEYFRRYFEKAALLPQASFVLLDHKGVVLFRYLDPENQLGKPFQPEAFQAMQTGPAEFTDIAAGLDGVRRIRSSVTLRLHDAEKPYLYIRASVPYDLFATEAWSKLIPNLSLQLGLLLLVAALMWYGGRHFILEPVAIIREAILRVKEGNLKGRISGLIKVKEFAHVAPVFDDMLSSLEASIAEREQAAKALQESTDKFLGLADQIPGYLAYVNADTLQYEFVNAVFEKSFGIPREKIIGSYVKDIIGEKNFQFALKYINETRAGRSSSYENTFNLTSGKRWIEVNYTPVMDTSGHVASIAVLSYDITRRKLAEEEKERLQEQLVQAQKMEVVGRLAGGVAHDFNNMLGVILGYTELLKEDCAGGSNMKGLLAIEKAALRSKDITRQLLAFSRKQIIAPKPMGINAILAESQQILTRLMGEDITLTLRLAPNLGFINMDPSQIDQILLNLAANARDAMPDGGEMIFATQKIQIDETFCRNRPGVTPGSYVRLTAEDTGTGMDTDTVAHIFEPFFTTKEVGKGTGLGLATIYGIMKQNNGHVEVSSAPGKGTVFTLYFPELAENWEKTDANGKDYAPTGAGTILVVEDEKGLRDILAAILKKLGYTVLSACSAEEAFTVFAQKKAAIDLLVTDVILPGMNGAELQKKLLMEQPGMKTLFISGFTADLIAQKGVLGEGVHFLAKPFTKAEVAQKVAEILTGSAPLPGW